MVSRVFLSLAPWGWFGGVRPARSERPLAGGSVRYALSLAGITGLTWFAWSGHTETAMLVFGLVSVAITVTASRRLGGLDAEGVPLAIIQPGQLTYLPWLLKELVLANLDVMRRVWSRDPGLSPSFVVTEPLQSSFVGRVLYANSITLTPGTVSVRMYDGEILVHALHEDAAEGLVGGSMNRRVAAVEGRP